jgi:hypothetical protein
MPTIKLPFVVKYISDQSQIDRHIKTTANNPTMYAHLSLLLRLFSSFGSMTFSSFLSKQFYCCLRTTLFLGFTLNLLGVAYMTNAALSSSISCLAQENYTHHQPVPIKILLEMLISVP